MITIQDIKVNVTRSGNGAPAVVLLHGWGQNQYMMKFLQDHLCDSFTVVNLDLPGFGESEEPRTVWSVDDYATFLHELLMHMHLTRVIFIAHSFGARIALRYAYRYPVEKMVLTGAAGIQAKRGLSYHIRVKTYKLLKRLHAAPAMGSSDYQGASPVMRGVLVASVEDDLRPLLKDIATETLLVWGERDMATPLWMGRVMEEELPDAALVVLPKEDHFAYFHLSIQFCRIVDAFLRP
ncbi:alpha/beta hydrolase [[Clostridium] innocuum]|nr:alpha/beta hydrolase [[Clostridium] innocuum]